MPASCQDTGTVSSPCVSSSMRASALADLLQVFFHQPPISGLMEFAFPAFLALSSLEQVTPLQCCEELYHGTGTGSSQTTYFLILS